ncbi:MAG: serine hydrolase domain-containing protein [Pseudomonadota bacterium]
MRALLVVLVVALVGCATPYAEEQSGSLRVGQPINAVVTETSKDTFSLHARIGQFILLHLVRGSFEQGQEVNLAVTVTAPSGAVVEDTNTASGTSLLALYPEETGVYEISVRRWNGASEGDYAVHLDTIERAPRSRVRRIGQLLDHLYTDERPGAAVAVVDQGRPVFAKTYGLASLEPTARMTKRTPLELASVSKQFTANAIAMLVADGRLSLTDKVSAYLPQMRPLGDDITIHHLVHHLSGLRDYDEVLGDREATHAAILEALYSQPAPYFSAGSEYRYSNGGYVLLAEIVRVVTGEPFPDWMRDNVFVPLGMPDSEITFATVPSYRKDGAGFDDIDVSPETYARVQEVLEAMGAAHVHASLDDMVRWAQNYRTQTLGGTEIADIIDDGIIPEAQPWDYVFGLHQFTDRGLLRRGHEGLTHGFRTQFVWFPDEDVFVVYLANDGEWRTYYLAEKIIDLYLGDRMTSDE